MRNIALRLSYDGTAYHGWQIQKTDVTVGGTVQKAISEICGEPITLVGCGRTDAGVHALRYCANFKTSSRIPIERIPIAINSHLPLDIAVRDAVETPEDFNAIGSCNKKEYVYRIHNSKLRNPFWNNRVCFYPAQLDYERLAAACESFVGTHDFAAVRSVGTVTKSTVRTIYHCHAKKDGDMIEIAVCANGFLYNMVRAIVGTTVYAAHGKIEPENIPRLLELGDRRLTGPTMPAQGLYMSRLWYDDEVHEMLNR